AVTILPANTTTGVGSSTSSSTWGQNVTFTATVTASAPGGGTPTGPVTFYDGSAILGAGTLQVVNGIDQAAFSTTSLNVGGHTITAVYGGDVNYNGSTSGSVAEIVGKATPQVTWANPADIIYGTPLSATQLDAAADVAGAFIYTPATGTVLNAGANHVLSVSFTPGDTADYTTTTKTVIINVTPATLTASAVNFSATAGAPFSGSVATISNTWSFLATTYSATITWGDGSTSAGVVTGSGSTLTITGSHTYADPVNEAVSVKISNPNTTTATVSDTAKVTSLGQGVTSGLTKSKGFWGNSNGQALIKSFNGGSTATALSSWLATYFSNLYGAGAGANNLTGKTNAQVAAFFLTEASLSNPALEAQVLTTALNVYATTSSLGGTAGQAYGFSVSATGLGARSFNVGKDGAAFGVANNTTLNVFELLEAVNKYAVNGVLYNGNTMLRNESSDLFNSLNNAGL
ncbi:MAG TPA: Ig-like domain-containing protein, partial [Gemmataceae bacterium]